jgi:hypothetical protein
MQQDLKFDVLVIDDYSSDAVPVHLTTTQAMELYLDRTHARRISRLPYFEQLL